MVGAAGQDGARMERRTGLETVRVALRWVLCALYAVAGIFHLVRPHPFVMITPAWVPLPERVILLTGLAELAGAFALAQPWSRALRRAAGVGLAVYAVCVYPANVNHMLIDMAQRTPALGWGYHVPRLMAQPLIVWLALWVGEVVDWPFDRRSRA